VVAGDDELAAGPERAEDEGGSDESELAAFVEADDVGKGMAALRPGVELYTRTFASLL
jgi:hypothetical protein